MAAKKIIKKLKLFVPAGKATPAPPLGPALGQAGVNIGDFVQKFNAATAQMGGETVGVALEVYEDRSYNFFVKTPRATDLLLKAAGSQKGSSKANTSKVGTITQAQLREIAERKMPDLNAKDIEGAMKTIAGTARQAGITIID